jgi:hypothetical protein
LRKSLTTGTAGIGILATMPKRPLKPQKSTVVAIYEKRQPARPHYLGKLMEIKDVDRGNLIEDLGVDKSLVSRWLDEDNPSTPGKVWAKKLGRYFAVGPEDEDFVDIFTDPTVARFQRITRGRTVDEIDRIFATIEAAFPPQKKTGT